MAISGLFVISYDIAGQNYLKMKRKPSTTTSEGPPIATPRILLSEKITSKSSV